VRAILVDRPGEIAIAELERPVPGSGELLIRLAATGVCHTDLTVLQGKFPIPMPVVLGHEGAGVVEELGPDVEGYEPGDHVILSIVIACGRCSQCRGGSPSLCQTNSLNVRNGTMPDGTTRLSSQGNPIHHMFCQSSFAEYAVVPQAAAVKVRRDAPLDVLSTLACGAMTGIGAVLNRACVQPGQSVCIVGVGGVGLSAVLAASAAGAYPIIAVDRSSDAVAYAQQIGATHGIVSDGTLNLADAIRDIVSSGVDHAIDAVGKSQTVEDCVAATAVGGQVTIVGLGSAEERASIKIYDLIYSRVVTGSRAGSSSPHLDIPRFTELFMAGRLALDKLVTNRISLDDVPAALKAMGDTVGRSVVVHSQMGTSSE
jgi:Zn-dependent alcohol dehydrogenase